ncbi:MAG TPA: hypothetical protein QGH10_20670 [Armatimonadota bacterium]|nr:hypothetical protein [Armatimonadota bacterium]
MRSIPIWGLGKLAARLTPTLIRLKLAQRRATRAFRDELTDMGLPRNVVDELSDAYPSIGLKDIKRGGEPTKS